MNLSALLPLIEALDAFKRLTSELGQQATLTADVIESARAPVLAALSRARAVPMIVLTARADRAKQITDELGIWSPNQANIFFFPEPDALFYERIPWSTETIAARLATLAALAQHPAPIVVTSIRAVMQKTVPPADLAAGMRVLRRGESVNLTELLSALVALGYQYQAVVESPGAFSRRGGILDVWCPTTPQPVRIELVGDEIDSLREFDPATQRSAKEIKAMLVVPASEALPGRGREIATALAHWDLSTCHPIAESAFKRDHESLAEGQRFQGSEFYLQYFYSPPASLLHHLADQGLLVVEDWSEIEASAQSLEFQAEDVRGDLEARRELPANVAAPYFAWNDLRNQMLARRRLLLDYATPGQAMPLPFTPGPRHGGQLRKVIDELFKQREERARIVVVSRQSARLSELLRERDFFV